MRCPVNLVGLVAGLSVGALLLSGCEGQIPESSESSRENLRRDLEVLAGDEMEGRGLGQPGLARALDYVAAALQEAGAEPGYRPGEVPPSFLQPVPVVEYSFGPEIAATIRTAAGEQLVRNGEDMALLAPGSQVANLPPTQPVFVGYGISEPNRGWDDYAGLNVNGRVVVMLEGVYPLLPEELQLEHSDPAVGGVRRAQAAEEHEVAGVIIVPPAAFFEQWQLLAGMRSTGTFAAARDYSIQAPLDSPFPVIALNRPVLETLFAQSGFDPFDASEDYRIFPLPGVEVGLTMDLVRRSLVSHNAVGLVPGTDPALKDEFVVVSAHVDHMGVVEGEIFNGANDDASGSVLVLELARRIARTPTPRPVLFVLFTAEESEHLGSIHFLDDFPIPNARVVANLNLEQMGRSGDGTLLTTATGELLAHAQATALTQEGWRVRPQPLESPQVLRGVDSYSFLLHGIPLVIMGGGVFSEYHSPDDDIALIDFDLLMDGLAAAEDLTRRLATPGGYRDEM